MLDFPRWKVILVLFTTVVGVIMALPSIVPAQYLGWAPQSFRDSKINLGLDLAGGSHLLLEADIDDLGKSRLSAMEEQVRVTMRREDPRIEISDISTAGGELSFSARDTLNTDKARERAYNLTSGVGVTGERDWNVDIRDGNRIVMTPTKAGLERDIDGALDTARDVVARRVDPSGTREVTVIRNGSDRILVQVPGLKDPQRLKESLGKTAKLEFKMVDETADPNEVAKGNAPGGSEVLPFADKEVGGSSIAVNRRTMVSGDELTDARATQDQNGLPAVSIQFNSQGGKKFARATSENVGKRFAIILDGTAISAPVIQTAILGGAAEITGRFTPEEANDLAVSLKSGKLPVALKVVEERTVGPDLGRESIEKGVLAAIVGSIALIGFMLFTYMRFGVYTAFALLLNALLVLGAMALFNATLTLPGIAGFVLTIGAAVDANVLINERIREELARGRNALSAVEFGYKEAGSAIFDANITNVISAVIMFWFGSGPVRGFAVVLAIGIITSVFTGVTLTRLMVADYMRRNRPRELVL
jgi:preprotein translocase subunit SecD